MKIKIEDGFNDPVIKDIKKFVSNALDGSDYERGALEEVEATAGNATEALGRLCDVLINHGTISPEELYYIATGYKSIDEKFTLIK